MYHDYTFRSLYSSFDFSFNFEMSNKDDLCRRLDIIPTSGAVDDETCRTFVLHEEDHTLGNSLRFMIAKNVSFCGYTIPHPSEHKINMRIQTNGIYAIDALRKGFSDLSDVCDHVQKKFELAVNNFKSMAMNEEEM